MLKANDWNTKLIRVNNDKITSWLHGKEMIYLKDEKIGTGKGFITLQIQDGGELK